MGDITSKVSKEQRVKVKKDKKSKKKVESESSESEENVEDKQRVYQETKRGFTMSMVIPSSIVDNAQSMELKTYLVG